MNKFVEDQMWLKREKLNSKDYDDPFYNGNPLVSMTNKSGHKIMEKNFGKKHYFRNVLEVGAGTGYHFSFINHKYNKYYMTDFSKKYLNLAKTKFKNNKKIEFKIEDATNLSFPDDTFDRLISVYNLEHLPDPHIVLKEWKRVLKKNGLLSIAIPLEGGVAWRLGRYLTTRKTFEKKGLDYNYIIAREHINASYNLISLIRHYFKNRNEIYYPFKIPLIDINLTYTCNIIIEK